MGVNGLDLYDNMTPYFHILFLFFSFSILIPDMIKAEERQKLAKERREEKAKYLGKLKIKGLGGQVHYLGGELPLVLG